ncbi:hypothetical protein LDENG_00192840 [Lucifuga dentata]|nr:hypothetical protein LDENG_00192840 [Lucifuga dentata]
MEEVIKQRALLNTTISPISPPNPSSGFAAYYTLIPLVLIALMGCVVVLVVCIRRRRRRLDHLRHTLIPKYTYDPTEQEDNWGDASEEERLNEPLYTNGKLSFTLSYGS